MNYVYRCRKRKVVETEQTPPPERPKRGRPPKEQAPEVAPETPAAVPAAAEAAAQPPATEQSEFQQRADEMSAIAQQQPGFDAFAQSQENNRAAENPADATFNAVAANASNSGQFENMGYDGQVCERTTEKSNKVNVFPMQNNPNMSNMGWESGAAAAPAGAMTPGHHSMGAPTPYRSEIDEVRIL